MALDFTVVIAVRQRFGDSVQDDRGQETSGEFVGQQKDYDFRCPRVDSREQAILLFQCQGANVQQSLAINGLEIYGGIPPAVERSKPPGETPQPNWYLNAQWNGNVMLIDPGVLRDNNVLRIRTSDIGDGGMDNFIIDNLVIVFKALPTDNHRV